MGFENFRENILGQAIVGTATPSLDLSLAPQNLQDPLHIIQEQDLDTECKFYRIFALFDTYAQGDTNLPVNSFTIQQMTDLQQDQAKETLAQKLASEQKLHKTRGRSKKEQDSILAQFNAHQGPKPLPFPNSYGLTEFPVEIEELLLKTIEDSKTNSYSYYNSGNILLFWLLYNLQPFNMQFSSRVTNTLLQIYQRPPYEHIGLRDNSYLVTAFWMKELIFRMGGANFRYTLTHCYREIAVHSIQELKDINKTIDALLAEVEKALALHHASTLLQTSAQDSTTVTTNNEATTNRSELGKHEPIELDYESLLKNLPFNEAKELLSLLRWKDPNQARLLLPTKLQRFKKDDNKISLLKVMSINLSIDDEPFLIQLLQETTSLNIKQVVRDLLCQMASPQYSALCKELCLKLTQFDGSEWKFQETVEFKEKLNFLGIRESNYYYKRGAFDPTSIKDLFDGLIWADLKEVALASSTEQALIAYSLESFNQVISYFSIMTTICRAISRSNEKQAISAYIDFTGLDQDVESFTNERNDKNRLVNDWFQFAVPMLMAMDIEQRCDFLERKQSYNISQDYFLENNSNALDFNLLDERWAQSVMINYLRGKSGYGYYDWSSYFALFMPPSIKDLLIHCRTVIEQGLPELSKLSWYIKDGLIKYDVELDTREYLRARFEFNLELRDQLMAKFTPLIAKLNTYPVPGSRRRNSCPMSESQLLSRSIERYSKSLDCINNILQLMEKREHIDKVIVQVLGKANR